MPPAALQLEVALKEFLRKSWRTADSDAVLIFVGQAATSQLATVLVFGRAKPLKK